jgi:hypothetical protein
MARRPTSVALVAATLVLTGVVSVLVGVLAAAVSGCCGSSEPADSSAALYGLAVGAAAGFAGAMLWRGRASRWLVLAASAVVPVAAVVAGASSSDLAAVAPLAVVGWLALAWFVSRGPAAPWLAGLDVGAG